MLQALDSQITTQLPDHTQLPCEDGTFVKNFQEHPQSILLTESIWEKLQDIHPDGQFCIGQDSGIYWRISDPPQRGAEAPDWFYVPDVPSTLEGQARRSYVMWQELVAPLIAIEFVSGSGAEERDREAYQGKFWVYEKAIRIPFYGIYEVKKASIEMYQLIAGKYQLMSPNERGHYVLEDMGVELGIWQGVYKNIDLPWLRWWDTQGNLLLTGEERADAEKQRADTEKQRADTEKQRADTEKQRADAEKQRAERLAARLRELGEKIDD
ncbi:MAG: Uma2 family endonuclease [Cyanobacteria bacterium SBLK]|nr:Uma2 family endonuclease [Cyanobacteria bacterium SBLK]